MHRATSLGSWRARVSRGARRPSSRLRRVLHGTDGSDGDGDGIVRRRRQVEDDAGRRLEAALLNTQHSVWMRCLTARRINSHRRNTLRRSRSTYLATLLRNTSGHRSAELIEVRAERDFADLLGLRSNSAPGLSAALSTQNLIRVRRIGNRFLLHLSVRAIQTPKFANVVASGG